jgi:hypothetical protein
MVFDRFSVLQLKKLLKDYNLHTKIRGFYKLNKDELIKKATEYLLINNNKILIKKNKNIIEMPEITNKTKTTSKNHTVEVEESPAQIKKEPVKSKRKITEEKKILQEAENNKLKQNMRKWLNTTH